MAGGDSIDGTAHRFLVKKALARQKEEEKEERRKAKEERKLEVTALLAVPMALRTPAQQRRIMELSDEVDAETHPKRRRKKRRKRRTPRSSSRFSRGRARRRQRQWYFYGWLRWLRCISRCVPSCRTKLLGIMDDMNQNDSIPFARRRLRLWHMQCWFYRYCTLRCVPFCFRQASDAHGRCGPEGQLCVEMVINILVVAQRQFPLVLTV